MRARLQHRQRAETAQLLQQFAHDLYNAFSRRRMVELCSGSGHNSPGFATSRAGYHAAASIAINNWLKLRKSQQWIWPSGVLLVGCLRPALGHERGGKIDARKIGAT